MDAKQKAREERLFRAIESAMETVAAQIDQLEKMDDFELVALYEEIEDLCRRTSFFAVSDGMFDFQDGEFDKTYEPTGDEMRAQVRRYDMLTKQHPTDAYRRFRAIADRMDDKCTAVDAILKDRQQMARSGARAKHANDPRARARATIRKEWERWQKREVVYKGDADFGRRMHLKHPEFISDRSIAQLAARWRKESRGDE